MSTKDKLLEANDLLNTVAGSLGSAQTLITAYGVYNAAPGEPESTELWAIMENLEMNANRVRKAVSLIEGKRAEIATD